MFSGEWGDEPQDNNAYICVRIADFDSELGKVIFRDSPTYRSYTDDSIQYKQILNGDILLEKSGGGEKTPVGRAVLWYSNNEDAPCLCANFIQVLRTKKNILHPKFLMLLLSTIHTKNITKIYIKQTIGIQNLTLYSYLTQLLPIPPLPEQEAIVAYLEGKVSLIDELVKKQEAQIVLLRELKQSIIAKAVIQGIDTDVALRSSGIPWIGEIPEHWEVKRLGQLSKEYYVLNKHIKHQNLLSLSYGRIISKDIDTTEGLLPASYDTYQVIRDGNIVLRLTDLQNDQRSLRVGLCTQEGIITSAYLALFPRSNVESNFLYYSLHTADIKKVFYGMGSGLRQSLNWKELRKLELPTPPLPEQEAIVGYISRKTFEIDNLIAKQEAQIIQLRELKQTLIADAVTGRINVQPS